MSEKCLRVGVVGVGHLGQHHARVFATIPGVELVGLTDTRPEQARAVAERTGSRVVDSYPELLDTVDAVSIAVPTFLHREIAGAALERGIATMVEKPLAGSLAEAEELVALARASGALLQVGHIERFNPALSALEGMSLRPKYLHAERLSTYTFRSTDIGVVLDLMIHDIDLILSMIASPVTSVSAVGVSVFGGHEDIANARIEFQDGCVADLTASRASFQATRKLRLYGSEGYASLDFATRQGTLVRPSDQLRRGEVDLDGLDLTRPEAIKERVFGKILRVDRVQVEGREPLAMELEDFVRAARGQGRPKVCGEQALRAMELADRILRSLNGHAWEGDAEGPVGPREIPLPSHASGPGHTLRGPISWRPHGARQTTSPPPKSTS
ncbi:MAG: Gfo/Idh/MocA family oxidoreductase [Isosphaeraceae bacterium]